jgi:hypothetical protein
MLSVDDCRVLLAEKTALTTSPCKCDSRSMFDCLRLELKQVHGAQSEVFLNYYCCELTSKHVLTDRIPNSNVDFK